MSGIDLREGEYRRLETFSPSRNGPVRPRDKEGEAWAVCALHLLESDNNGGAGNRCPRPRREAALSYSLRECTGVRRRKREMENVVRIGVW